MALIWLFAKHSLFPSILFGDSTLLKGTQAKESETDLIGE